MTKTIALAGNPNVGKSTIFNGLTGLRQHTGNWPGKTVSSAKGKFFYKKQKFEIIDLPGSYSLSSVSEEEEITKDFVCFKDNDLIVVVADSTCLERNLNFVLQILKIRHNVILCLNLDDEAKRKNIFVDHRTLSTELNIPVIKTNGKNKNDIKKLARKISKVLSKNEKNTVSKYEENEKEIILNSEKSKELYKKCVNIKNKSYNERDRKIDKILTSKVTGIPIMLLLLGIVFWITIAGANYPSEIISTLLSSFEKILTNFFENINAPNWLHGILVSGIYRTLSWVISVMLPPMAIFFPLFTILEDLGYLPRVAFNLDNIFRKSGAHGKQALTMCMGFGCNACGITSCRIIDSKREKIIAMLTNNFIPCNGRFPILISIITMFFIGFNNSFSNSLNSSLILTSIILFGILMTFISSKLLSKTLLKGEPSSFVLELPPYRKPQFLKVIIRSIFDRTLCVLLRAMAVAAPAGLLIWVMANIKIYGTSLLYYCSSFWDPFARLIGLDGVIFMAFILGFPANEIVMPIIIMAYFLEGSIMEVDGLLNLRELLVSNGWTALTAICTMIFSLMHFPCGTTCLTIKKESKSLKWTIVAFLLPTFFGIVCCFIVATVARMFG